MKPTTKTTKPAKLVDILKKQDEQEEEFYFVNRAKEAENNSRIEIASLEKEVYDYEKSVATILFSNNFSISKLYEAETKLMLLKKKLDWSKEKFEELF